jgi:acetolactate synthase-1/3 small subunit
MLVENEYGMLSRIAGLFSARGYTVDTLCVGPTLEEDVARMTLTTHGNDQVIEQIIKQLRKLVKVIKVTDLTERALMLSVRWSCCQSTRRWGSEAGSDKSG